MSRQNIKTLDRLQKKILAVTEDAQRAERLLICDAAQYPDFTLIVHFGIEALCVAAQREIERIGQDSKKGIEA